MVKKVLLLTLSLMIVSCVDTDKLSSDSVVDKNAIKRTYTELDKWIYENYTKPYGIDVNYRWERNNTDRGTYLYPPKLENIQPVLETVKELFLELYTKEEVGGAGYMKEKNPIRIHLYGGENLDVNNVELLANNTGVATEMYIYNVNAFDKKNHDRVFELMRSVHHQFAKRLTELFPYDRDKFLQISQNKYSSSTADFIASVRKSMSRKDFFSASDYANKRGFFTMHSFLSAEDDFAEIVSIVLNSTPKEILRALKRAETPSGDGTDIEEVKQSYAQIKKKYDMVLEYYKKTLGINLERMQIISAKQIKTFKSKNV